MTTSLEHPFAELPAPATALGDDASAAYVPFGWGTHQKRDSYVEADRTPGRPSSSSPTPPPLAAA